MDVRGLEKNEKERGGARELLVITNYMCCLFHGQLRDKLNCIRLRLRKLRLCVCANLAECLPGMFKALHKPGMAVHTCNPRI